MLKATLLINEAIDISIFKKVLAFLKRRNDDYVPKKSKILTWQNVEEFLKNAPDDKFLLIKVALLFGLNGACSRAELHNLMIQDITDNGIMVIVNLHDTKTKKHRFFIVVEECNGYQIYKKYSMLRPPNIKHDKFFYTYITTTINVRNSVSE